MNSGDTLRPAAADARTAHGFAAKVKPISQERVRENRADGGRFKVEHLLSYITLRPAGVYKAACHTKQHLKPP